MCGIVGTIGQFDEQDALERALYSIKHRGPDDEGYWKDEHVFFGHVRLSILDTSSLGHQPMVSSDSRYVLIFNGEIYNHIELRNELIKSGFSFRSTSDTETLLAGLIQSGHDFIKRLNGIFAFAFYDTVQHRVILARDHFGIKPLYYLQNEKGIVFSSEAKAILPFVSGLTLQPENLSDYLTFLWCPGQGTPVKEIKKVLPGCYVSIRIEQKKISADFIRYYDIPFTGVYQFNQEKETVDLLDEKIQQAVSRQLLSDVPLGFFLSGGLDSSLLVAMGRKLTTKPIQCFTIETKVDDAVEGFQDDLGFAKKVADHLDVKLEVVKADVDIVRDFDKMIWHLDEPQADAAPLNVMNICERASTMGFKVLLGGTAGDDLFSGYRRHQALNAERFLKFIPSAVRKMLISIPLDLRVAFFRRVRKVALQLDKPMSERLANYYCWLPPERSVSLLTKDLRQQIGSYRSTDKLLELLQCIPAEVSWLNKMLYWEMKTFLVDHNLNYTDKMGMAKGVEIRVPYLDVELVEFACSIDPQLKMKSGETKYILKKVAERYLPKEVIYRSKTGFGAPVRKWILEDLEDMIKERLSKEKIVATGIFDEDEVWKLIEDNKTGKVDASYSVWSLLAIDSWIRQFFKHSN